MVKKLSHRRRSPNIPGWGLGWHALASNLLFPLHGSFHVRYACSGLASHLFLHRQWGKLRKSLPSMMFVKPIPKGHADRWSHPCSPFLFMRVIY